MAGEAMSRWPWERLLGRRGATDDTLRACKYLLDLPVRSRKRDDDIGVMTPRESRTCLYTHGRERRAAVLVALCWRTAVM